MIESPTDSWEPLWASGRRYRQITDTEERLLAKHPGRGHGRPALDVGCGDASATRPPASTAHPAPSPSPTPRPQV
ncbi:hypothetical protein ACFQ51_44225 [Streptomyces kaempferi]